MSSGLRRNEREPGDAFATLSWGGNEASDQAFCVVIDVSRDGMRVRTPQPPEDGSKVVVRVGLGEEVHALGARVAWVKQLDDGHDVGLEFVEHEDEHIWFLDEVRRSVLDLRR